jgi:hypothetical protein
MQQHLTEYDHGFLAGMVSSETAAFRQVQELEQRLWRAEAQNRGLRRMAAAQGFMIAAFVLATALMALFLSE